MLKINRQTDYAVRVVLALAKHGEGARLSSADIQQEMLIPKAFMSRIVAQLSRERAGQYFPRSRGRINASPPRSADHFEGCCRSVRGTDPAFGVYAGQKVRMIAHSTPIARYARSGDAFRWQ